MTTHSDLDRLLLRKMRMSEQSELTATENRRMAAVRAAYAKNPGTTGDRLYRILRPPTSED